ncbi:MAG TPA: pentapeptide repeat-containing protein, partial [Candidatus Poseidoniales archaeon]
MVMSSPDGPKDEEEKLDLSYQNHTSRNFRRGRHPNSSFKRTILDKADLTEANFSHSDFRKASLVEADLMKSSFDHCDFRGANLKKARLNLSTFRNCQFDDADIRGIRGKYAIW